MSGPNRLELRPSLSKLQTALYAGGVAFPLLLLATCVATLWYGYSGLSSFQADHYSVLVGRLAGMLTAAFFMFVCLGICFVRRVVLYLKHTLVVLDNSGITVTDWRGEERQVPFCKIREVRVVTCGGLRRPPTIAIATHDDRVTLLPGVRDHGMMFRELVQRAQLRCTEQSWYHAIYTPG